MKNSKKPPISVKIICEVDKNGRGATYLVNKHGRKLDVFIENIEFHTDVEPVYMAGNFKPIDEYKTKSDIRFTGVIKFNKKNPARYTIKGK